MTDHDFRTTRTTTWWCGLLACGLCLLATGNAQADFGSDIDLERPGERQFVLDKANLISDADEQQIKQIADKLLTDKAAPIIVVTIESMARHGGTGLRIETFARLLFDQWGIGHEKVHDQLWNYGILLLVSRDDHRARIELGAGWRRDKDVVAQSIMDKQIISHFKVGDFSGGITQGVISLDKMARDLQLPTQALHSTRPKTATDFILPLVLVGLAVFTVVSLIRRGSGGWAWVMWSIVFGIVGTILYTMATSSRHHRGGFGGGSFGGGSFGGGFSGGGGASGSW